MSVHSHEIALQSVNIGRPPIAFSPSRRCDALISPSEARQASPCGLFAIWLLPEVSRCHHHVPTAMIDLAQKRADLWNELAVETWEFVLERLPGDPKERRAV